MGLSDIAWRMTWPWRAKLQENRGPGSVMPDFELQGVDGRRYRLSDDGGKRTLLWFTNLCDGCQKRAPLLNELLEKAGSILRVLAVNILPEEDTARRLSPTLKFPILLDPEDIVQKRLGIAHPPGTCPLRNLYVIAPGRTVLLKHHLSALKPGEVGRIAEL